MRQLSSRIGAAISRLVNIWLNLTRSQPSVSEVKQLLVPLMGTRAQWADGIGSNLVLLRGILKGTSWWFNLMQLVLFGVNTCLATSFAIAAFGNWNPAGLDDKITTLWSLGRKTLHAAKLTNNIKGLFKAGCSYRHNHCRDKCTLLPIHQCLSNKNTWFD